MEACDDVPLREGNERTHEGPVEVIKHHVFYCAFGRGTVRQQ